jgi:N utilization substance protein B
LQLLRNVNPTKSLSKSNFQILSENNSLSIALKIVKSILVLNDDYILLLLNDVKASDLYANYMSNSVNTFEEDRQFIVDLFMEVIVPNEKLYEYLEDDKLTWVDDIPVVNTHIIKIESH